MSAAQDFRAALLAHAPLATRVNSAIAHNAAPSVVELPFIVFREEHDISHTLAGDVASDRVTFTAECWGKNAAEADAVADLAVAACEAHDAASEVSVTVLARTSSFDPEMGEDAVILTVEWWV